MLLLFSPSDTYCLFLIHLSANLLTNFMISAPKNSTVVSHKLRNWVNKIDGR